MRYSSSRYWSNMKKKSKKKILTTAENKHWSFYDNGTFSLNYNRGSGRWKIVDGRLFYKHIFDSEWTDWGDEPRPTNNALVKRIRKAIDKIFEKEFLE